MDPIRAANVRALYLQMRSSAISWLIVTCLWSGPRGPLRRGRSSPAGRQFRSSPNCCARCWSVPGAAARHLMPRSDAGPISTRLYGADRHRLGRHDLSLRASRQSRPRSRSRCAPSTGSAAAACRSRSYNPPKPLCIGRPDLHRGTHPAAGNRRVSPSHHARPGVGCLCDDHGHGLPLAARALDGGIRIRFEESLAWSRRSRSRRPRRRKHGTKPNRQASAKSQFLAAASHDLRQPLYALEPVLGIAQCAEAG